MLKYQLHIVRNGQKLSPTFIHGEGGIIASLTVKCTNLEVNYSSSWIHIQSPLSQLLDHDGRVELKWEMHQSCFATWPSERDFSIRELSISTCCFSLPPLVISGYKYIYPDASLLPYSRKIGGEII